MFGRLNEDAEFEREYLIVSNFVDEDPIVFSVTTSPGEIKESLKTELEDYRGIGFSVFELVEYVEVSEGGDITFTEDWAGIAGKEDEQED